MAAPQSICVTCDTLIPDEAAFCPSCGASTGLPTELSGGLSAEDAPQYRDRLQVALGEGYELRGVIGQGGFGTVYAAWDVGLEREVAIKVLRSDLYRTPDLIARFKREARAVAQLRHPNIVPVYSVGEAGGLTYFVMPLIKGSSLRDILESEGQLPIGESQRIVTEAAKALEAAHRAGIVHRDVKPENILLEGEDRHVQLMDFGIAKVAASDEVGLTGTGLIVGTPQYMSPEQASGERELDIRSDIYSLGVVAYRLLGGKLPFEAKEEILQDKGFLPQS